MNDDLMKVVVNIVELIISGGLVVLIWIIQILHYPSFRFVHRDVFKEFEAFHTLRISLIVMPLMIAELALVVVNFRWVIFLLTLLIWLSTFFLQVPCHDKLRQGYDEEIISRLISTNWIRTILWSVKFLLLFLSAKFI